MPRAKKVSLALIAVLFIWFLLDITGLSFGTTTIVVSALIDEPIDIAFALVFAIAIFLFVWREKVGEWAVLIFLCAWATTQGSAYFREDFSGYYAFFAREGTHRILPQSTQFLIKDTYHLMLDLLILASLIGVIVFLILSKGGKSRIPPAGQ
ncbi:MAG: hypothetical protein LBJ08_12220 [Bifidobacteriaceae bacterium]|jgi:hypothetical protein|nr:hypothetical protein [Bifidobacteriaceae bacterium]